MNGHPFEIGPSLALPAPSPHKSACWIEVVLAMAVEFVLPHSPTPFPRQGRALTGREGTTGRGANFIATQTLVRLADN